MCSDSAGSSSLHSASLVQPARIRGSISSPDTSTVRSGPMQMCRPEKVYTDPTSPGARRQTRCRSELPRFSRACICIRMHSKYAHPGDGRLNQSRNCAVESTWSSYLPLGKTVISCRYSSSHGAGLGDVDEAVLDHRGLRVHTHDLIAGRLVSR